ncbi:DJ-1/PfpI family protein [Massilia sp. P8910]|uniref:DJ-1/PfpI family protein n=1 Tax=Massilia antarctica TaxID=2765360 RepID=UPI0009EB3F36|nr:MULTISPECIES: DJ-1/PfpI family protein [Massilia]MCE3605540.1 DJ-1/PfpI family protein [Massilia antarctica]MCY0915170.1 DJ-1/PfpI family protein [Massilia sp. H27-R4]
MTGFTRLVLIALASLALTAPASAQQGTPVVAAAVTEVRPSEKIDAYAPRFGRTRPVIAVLGENSGTVMSDFVLPYGVLAQSGVADVVSVATQAGLLQLPPLKIAPDNTVAQFDQRYPDGADYVVVPAMNKSGDPTLLAWVGAQAAKGATMVSICNGSIVLAKAGLTRGHRATGHWSTHQSRVAAFPETVWLKNTRYVADGKIVSSAGISAAIPTALALVEAIGGSERARVLATQLGMADWGSAHNSDSFHITFGDRVTAVISYFLRPTQDIGIPVADGVDELALSLTADAYTATLRARVHALAQSDSPVRTRNGLMLVPDMVAGRGKQPESILPGFDSTPSALVLDKALDDITTRYGAAAARFVVLEAEYPRQGR